MAADSGPSKRPYQGHPPNCDIRIRPATSAGRRPLPTPTPTPRSVICNVCFNPGLRATTHEITIPGAAESAQAATNAWLSANANAKGPFAIFNCYDDDAMGAIAALKQNGRKDVQVYSFNATAPAVQAVKDGTMTATLGVDLTSAGKELIDQIPDIIKAGNGWEPKSFIPGYTIVTKANVDQFLKSHPQ